MCFVNWRFRSFVQYIFLYSYTVEFLVYFSTHLEDNCIQTFHLGRYNAGKTFKKLPAMIVIPDSIYNDISPNENFENGNPQSYSLRFISNCSVASCHIKPHII